MSDEGLKAFNEYSKIKKNSSRKKYRDIFDEYDFIIVKEVNNIVTFIHNETTFYFTELTGTIREQGSKEKIKLTNFLKGEY